MKYKVGDKVKIKNNLIGDKRYVFYFFFKEMEPYKGQTVTIAKAEDKYDCYTIKEDNGEFYWNDAMIEGKEK